MTWTFDQALSTLKDQVRLKIGDTNTADQQIQNETIIAVLATRAAVLPASIECVRVILGRIARDHDRSMSSMSSQVSEAFDHYKVLLESLELQYGAEVQPFLGGASIAAIQTIEANTNFRPMSFGVGRDDNKQASPVSGSNGQIQTP